MIARRAKNCRRLSTTTEFMSNKPSNSQNPHENQRQRIATGNIAGCGFSPACATSLVVTCSHGSHLLGRWIVACSANGHAGDLSARGHILSTQGCPIWYSAIAGNVIARRWSAQSPISMRLPADQHLWYQERSPRLWARRCCCRGFYGFCVASSTPQTQCLMDWDLH